MSVCNGLVDATHGGLSRASSGKIRHDESAECTITTRSQPSHLRAQPTVQHHIRGDVRHFWQIRRHQTNTHRSDQGDARNGLCGVRGHLRRQERCGASVGVQRGQSVPHSALLPAGQVHQEDRP
ncbi:unnamed protein product, partial [Closterium sp. Yama58-4]